MDEGGRFEIYCGFTPTVGSNPTLSALRREASDSVNRRDDRVDEGARLESECAATYRGFESHSFRHTACARWRDGRVLSTEDHESRQARKGATVVGHSGRGAARSSLHLAHSFPL